MYSKFFTEINRKRKKLRVLLSIPCISRKQCHRMREWICSLTSQNVSMLVLITEEHQPLASANKDNSDVKVHISIWFHSQMKEC
jgi:hypothetical protein